jgi:thymidine kinase
MSLELIIGPMFAGKSSALQSIVRRRMAIGWNVLVLKHGIDVRYLSQDEENNVIVNHDLIRCPAVPCTQLMDSLKWSDFTNARLIVIEEGQFFNDLVKFVTLAVETFDKHVVVVGLDGDAHRRPFGQILDLIPLSDEVHRIYALCKLCADGTPARFTSANSTEVLVATDNGQPNVGASESYQPLCRKHFLERYIPN